MRSFCTLFDSNYLSRGLAMYESLKRQTKNFHLYILAFDEKCERILKKLSLQYVTVISLSDFEDEELKEVKKTRTRGEYCWTCTPSLLKYCLEKYNLDMCTYLDADIYFYSDPEPLFEEMGDASIMISPHWYTPVYDQSQTSGIYCVQFVTFRRDERGMKALEWWRKSCNTWCYARAEEGKFGDQKYLDDWPVRFEGVHVIQHRGGGVAPWNVQQYNLFTEEKGKIFFTEKRAENVFLLIFYHFHNLRFIDKNRIDLDIYYIPRWVKKKIYSSYIFHLLAIEESLRGIEEGDYQGRKVLKRNFGKKILSFFARVNVLKLFFFFIFNMLFRYMKDKYDKNPPLWLSFFARLLIISHNIYSLNYFEEN